MNQGPMQPVINAPPTLEQTSDEVLAIQARDCPEFFTSLYQRYLPKVYRYHLSHTCDVQEAEELTSQTFIGALENLPQFNRQRTFRCWLFGIARHKLVDYLRKSHRDLSLEKAEDTPAREPTPEEQAFHKLNLAEIARVMKQLPADQVEALSLRIFCELSAAEAGTVMGKSEAAVKMLVLRGFRNLQQRLVLKMEVVNGHE
jgi:RNA polymerase sigma-70 factor, ECF subfamily